MPNKMLVESMIDNYTLRPFRRVDRIIALSRDTMHEQMITIIAGLKKRLASTRLQLTKSISIFMRLLPSPLKSAFNIM